MARGTKGKAPLDKGRVGDAEDDVRVAEDDKLPKFVVIKSTEVDGVEEAVVEVKGKEEDEGGEDTAVLLRADEKEKDVELDGGNAEEGVEYAGSVLGSALSGGGELVELAEDDSIGEEGVPMAEVTGDVLVDLGFDGDAKE